MALLADPSPEVRAEAHAALKTIMRIGLPLDRETWERWHAATGGR